MVYGFLNTPSWIVLERARSDSVAEFVGYWEQFYVDSKQRPDSKFLAHLKWKGGKLTSEDVRYLFRWKYRDVPNWSAEPTIRRLHQLNRLRFTEGDSLVKLATKLSPSGLVKRFFICHIVNPLKYPLWDQYVLRAHLIISNRENEIDDVLTLIKDTEAYESYRRSFNDWGHNVLSSYCNDFEFPPFRRLDRALWAMGKYYSLLIRSPEN